MRRSRLAVGGVLALLVTGVAGARVLAPADTLDRSRAPYPPAVTVEARLYGELMSAPLFIGTRMRVYAGDNRVWADGPVDARLPTSALWAFRRWPAKVVGVVAGGQVVVSKWSDGELVAIDPDRGRIVWRAHGPVGATGYQGRRTGARTVYDPPDLYLGTTAGGRTVIVSTGRQGVTSFDAGTGAELWHHDGGGGTTDCRTEFTGPELFVVVQECGETGIFAVDLATGQRRTDVAAPLRRLQPVGCALGHSECAALGAELLYPDGRMVQARGLVGAVALAGGRALVTTPGGGVVARNPVTGDELWSWGGFGGEPARIIAVEPDAVHLLTAGHGLVTLGLTDGTLRSWVPLQIDGEDDGWQPGYVYAADGLVAIERLLPGARADRPDSAYYYPFPTVLFSGS